MVVAGAAAAEVDVDDEIDVEDPASMSDDELQSVYDRAVTRVEMLRQVDVETPPELHRISHREWLDLAEDVDYSVEPAREVMWRALMVVEDDERVEEVLRGDAAEGTLAFYLSGSHEIYLVSDGDVDERVLAHEITHGLQHERHEIEDGRATWDEAQGYAGLYEGEAELVRELYRERCEDDWSCFTGDGGALEPDSTDRVEGGETAEAMEDGDDGDSSSLNYGVYAARFHPYSDGSRYVDSVRDEGGWDVVDERIRSPPQTTSEVIHLERKEAAEPGFEDSSTSRWRLLRRDGEPVTESMGEAAVYSMFLHQSLVYLDNPVVTLEDFLDGEGRSVYSYDSSVTRGWRGDRLDVYLSEDVDAAASGTSQGLASSGYGFVWTTVWSDGDSARRFHLALERVLHHHGEVVDDGWRLTGVYDGGYRVERADDTVRVARAPDVAALDEVAPDVSSTYVTPVRGGGTETGALETRDGSGAPPMPQPALSPVMVVAVLLLYSWFSGRLPRLR